MCVCVRVFTRCRRICFSRGMCVLMWVDGPEGETRSKTKGRKREEKVSVDSVLPPSLVPVSVCLHGAHILSRGALSGPVWPDLFTLQARLQLSNTYQNI